MKSDKKKASVSHDVDQTEEEIKSYWTREKMAKAKPLPMEETKEK